MEAQEQAPAFAANTRTKVKKAAQKARRVSVEELADLKAVLLVPAGRRVLKRIVDFCGVLKTTYTGDDHGAFREGQRAVGLKIIGEIAEADRSAFAEIVLDPKPQVEEGSTNA